jgi:flagellin
VTYQDSTTQTSAVVGSFAAGSSVTYNGTTLNFGNFTSSDAGATATVQATAATSGTTGSGASVQSGPNAGETTNVDFANATTTGLGITNLDVSTPAAATNTEGQIANAQASLDRVDATLGAQSASLGAAFDNNNVLSNNLTASASAIGDTSEAQSSISSSLASIQTQISYAVLARANADAGHLSSFLSQYA